MKCHIGFTRRSTCQQRRNDDWLVSSPESPLYPTYFFSFKYHRASTSPTNGAPHRARTRSPTRHSDDPIPVRPQYILGLRPNELPFSHGLKPKSNRRSVHGSPRIPRSPRPIQIAIDRCVMHTCSLRRALGHQGHHMDMDLDW